MIYFPKPIDIPLILDGDSKSCHEIRVWTWLIREAEYSWLVLEQHTTTTNLLTD